jgi:hypothetical protein
MYAQILALFYLKIYIEKKTLRTVILCQTLNTFLTRLAANLSVRPPRCFPLPAIGKKYDNSNNLKYCTGIKLRLPSSMT